MFVSTGNKSAIFFARYFFSLPPRQFLVEFNSNCNMNEFKMNCSFVSEKISKIRWMPEQQNASELFVTGSWDFDENTVRTWKFMQNEYSDEDVELIPLCTAKLAISEDVYGLEPLDSENFVVGSSGGSVRLIHLDRSRDQNNLSEKHVFKGLHTFGVDCDAACTGLSVLGTDIATVGEDGCLNVLSMSQRTVAKTIKKADSCSITCVSFIGHQELIIGNRMGFLKIFDIRAADENPTGTFLTSCSDDKVPNAATSIAYHPTQKHIIIIGTEEGSVTVWDLRQPNYPASYLTAHNTAITEVNFHETDPTKLFTAAEGGELFQWSHNNQSNNFEKPSQYSDGDLVNPWLSGERTKHRIKGTPLITGIKKSINSFHAVGSKVLACADNEAIYLIDNLY